MIFTSTLYPNSPAYSYLFSSFFIKYFIYLVSFLIWSSSSSISTTPSYSACINHARHNSLRLFFILFWSIFLSSSSSYSTSVSIPFLSVCSSQLRLFHLSVLSSSRLRFLIFLSSIRNNFSSSFITSFAPRYSVTFSRSFSSLLSQYTVLTFFLTPVSHGQLVPEQVIGLAEQVPR